MCNLHSDIVTYLLPYLQSIQLSQEPKGSWECSSCMVTNFVTNASTGNKCIACGTNKQAATATSAGITSKSSVVSDLKVLSN